MVVFKSNGVPINYRCVGKGRDIVLIHGLAANHAFWHLSVLLPLARKYRVTVYDLRGHGYSGMPPSGYTTEDMAEDLDRLLDHLQIERADLVGHSFGGVVALHYAVCRPERVSSLVIADARLRSIQPTNHPRTWSGGDRAMKKLAELGLEIPPDETDAGIWLLEHLALPEWQPLRHKLDGQGLFLPFGRWNGGQRAAEQWLELLRTTTARSDFRSLAGLTLDRLAGIRQPTLGIYGERSATIPSLRGLQGKLSDCRPVIVPGAGHFFPLTHSDLFVHEVDRFLSPVVV